MELINKVFLFAYKLNRKWLAAVCRGKNIAIRQSIKCGRNTLFYLSSTVTNLQEKEKLSVGDGCHIRGELFVYPYGEGLHIGNDCYIGDNVVVRSGGGIYIGNSVLIAHDVTIIDSDSHEIDPIERDLSFKSLVKKGHPVTAGNVKTAHITIKDHAWISYGVCILKGVTIGEGAIVGAGSVVTKDVPNRTIVAGNPAVPINKIPP